MYTAIVHFHPYAQARTVLYEVKDRICLPISLVQWSVALSVVEILEWIGAYYQVYPGDVYHIVPALVKMKANPGVINPDLKLNIIHRKRTVILDALSGWKPVNVAELNKVTEMRDVAHA